MCQLCEQSGNDGSAAIKENPCFYRVSATIYAGRSDRFAKQSLAHRASGPSMPNGDRICPLRTSQKDASWKCKRLIFL